MGRILHNWDLATMQMLLAKAHQALPPGEALIVYERLIDDARRSNTAGLISSLNMLVITDGGFDFTGADCARWMQEAGLQRIRTEPLVDGPSMVVGFKWASLDSAAFAVHARIGTGGTNDPQI